MARDLDLLGPAGNPLVGDDDVDAVHLGGERGHLGQSLVELLTESVGDLDVASSDDDLHGSSLIAHVLFVRCSESGFRASGHLGPGPPVIQAPPLPVDLVPGRRPDGRARGTGSMTRPYLRRASTGRRATPSDRTNPRRARTARPQVASSPTSALGGCHRGTHDRARTGGPQRLWRLRRTWHPSSRRHRPAGFGVRRSRCATRDSPTGRRRGCHAAQPFPGRTGPPPGARARSRRCHSEDRSASIRELRDGCAAECGHRRVAALAHGASRRGCRHHDDHSVGPARAPECAVHGRGEQGRQDGFEVAPADVLPCGHGGSERVGVDTPGVHRRHTGRCRVRHDPGAAAVLDHRGPLDGRQGSHPAAAGPGRRLEGQPQQRPLAPRAPVRAGAEAPAALTGQDEVDEVAAPQPRQDPPDAAPDVTTPPRTGRSGRATPSHETSRQHRTWRRETVRRVWGRRRVAAGDVDAERQPAGSTGRA